MRHAQQTANLEMLSRLRLDGFIGSHYQQYKIDPCRAGQHIADKSFVARHIHKTEPDFAFFEKGKAEIDRDPAALFFFEPVRVRAGEGLDERRFAMIDVPCRADDDAFQSWSHRRSRARPRAAQTGMLLERQGRVKPARRGSLFRGGKFVEDGLRCRPGIARRKNWAAYDNEISPGANRL